MRLRVFFCAGGAALDSVQPGGDSAAMKLLLKSSRAMALAALLFSVSAAGAAPTHWTVVSDIDDTIRQTGVVRDEPPVKPLDAHRKNYAHLLGDPFRRWTAVPDMAARYSQWHARDRAEFFYLSRSPWFYRWRLGGFLHAQGFPEGRILLNPLFPFALPRYKDTAIRKIFRAQPDGAFVFVGDSGERDPEIYAHLAHEFPRAVRRIFIRDVTPHDPALRSRLALAKTPCVIFTDAARLPAALDRPAKLPARHDQKSLAHRR